MSIPFEKSFASHPKSKYWSDKNNCKPCDVSMSSHTKRLFDCECGHSFDMALNNIKQGCWCPYCASPTKKLCTNELCNPCFDKSFASHPNSIFWSSKNVCQPRDIQKSSNKFWLFDCPVCNHEYEQPLNASKGCSYCNNKKLCSNNDCQLCFVKSFASHPNSAFWSSKNDCKPRDVFKSTGKEYLFVCKCGHTIKKTLDNISRGGWCPYCSNPPQKLCDNSECISCYNKSFESHEKSKYWSSKNNCKPRDVFKKVSDKYKFDCPNKDCKHRFEQSLREINAGSWCPYCATPSKILCNDELCKPCFDKSFASHPKSAFWSEKNNCKPRYVFRSSDTKYWLDCIVCNHEFEKSLSGISTGGHWCPYCVNQKLCDNNNCQTCFDKSLASQPNSKFWSVKNVCNPRDIFKSSGKKYLFDCDKCKREFPARPCTVTKGVWCPFCVNKTEAKLYEKMLPFFPSIIRQFKQDWCKKINHLPFDFCIPELKIIIELDGPQHSRQIANWASPEETKQNDKYKEECANNNGYSVIRLTQIDVFYDTFDWVKELCDTIEEIKTSGEIKNTYLCIDDEYNDF